MICSSPSRLYPEWLTNDVISRNILILKTAGTKCGGMLWYTTKRGWKRRDLTRAEVDRIDKYNQKTLDVCSPSEGVLGQGNIQKRLFQTDDLDPINSVLEEAPQE